MEATPIERARGEVRMARVPVRLAVVSALLALAFGACTPGGGTTGPSAAAPPPPTSIQTWGGSFRFNSETRGRVSGTARFEGTVTWQKEQAPDPGSIPIRAGAVRYRVASGQVTFVSSGRETFEGYEDVCNWEGNGSATLGPNDPVPDPELRSSIDLSDDGRYTGSLYVLVPATQVRSCPGVAPRTIAADGTLMYLPIAGSLTPGPRMSGEMAPHVDASATETGSWDFAPR
jgi:hypothetical protein